MVKFRKSSFIVFLLCISAFVHARDELVWMWPEDQERMLNYATMFEGAPYAFGARKPSSEDCSSFIQKIFTLIGVELPRSSRDQALDPRFVEVPLDERRTGDLIFFKNTYRRGISHVAYSMDSETIIHASPKSKKITRDSLTPRHPLWKRIHSVRRWKHIMEESHLRPQFAWDDKI